MSNYFRNKKNLGSRDVDRLIKELKELNESNNNEIKELREKLDELYEKNKSDNEVKKGIDAVMQVSMVIIFYIFAFVFGIASIIYPFYSKQGWLIIVETTTLYVVLSVLFVILALRTKKETNRNFIVACFSGVVAFIALLIALLK